MRRVLLYLLDRALWAGIVGIVVYAALVATRPAPEVSVVTVTPPTPAVYATAHVTPRYHFTNPDALATYVVREARDLDSLKNYIDCAMRDGIPLELALHWWADGRPYGGR